MRSWDSPDQNFSAFPSLRKKKQTPTTLPRPTRPYTNWYQVNFLTLSLCTSSGAFLQYLLWSYADLCTGAFVLVIFYAWNYLLFNLKMTFQFIQISAQTLLTNIFITVLSKIIPHNFILPIFLSFLKIMTSFILRIFVCYGFYIFYSFLLSLRKK